MVVFSQSDRSELLPGIHIIFNSGIFTVWLIRTVIRHSHYLSWWRFHSLTDQNCYQAFTLSFMVVFSLSDRSELIRHSHYLSWWRFHSLTDQNCYRNCYQAFIWSFVVVISQSDRTVIRTVTRHLYYLSCWCFHNLIDQNCYQAFILSFMVVFSQSDRSELLPVIHIIFRGGVFTVWQIRTVIRHSFYLSWWCFHSLTHQNCYQNCCQAFILFFVVASPPMDPY